MNLSSEQNEIEKLNGVRYTRELESASGNMCLLDMVAFNEGDEVFLFQKCKHIFHIACINEWNRNHAGQCPSCS